MYGIKVNLSKRNELLKITYVFADGPADRAGLKPGDIIVEASGKSMAKLSLGEAIGIITGRPNTTVTMKIRSPQANKDRIIELARTKIHIPEEVNTDVGTYTWVNQQGWKIVVLTKSSEEANRKFKDGDYEAALESAKQWLMKDPHSEDAYHLMYFAKARMRDTKGIPGIIRALLSINPHSSTALHAAIANSDDPEISLIFLERMGKHDMNRKGCVHNIALSYLKMEKYRDVQKLLEKEKCRKSSVGLYLQSLILQGRKKKAKEFMGKLDSRMLQKEMDNSDSQYAVGKALKLGRAAFYLGLKDSARSWAEYALFRDPTNNSVLQFIKELRRR